MSIRHCLEEDYDRVATLTKQAAELGDAEANFLLATVHRTRHGVEMDDDKYSHQRPPQPVILKLDMIWDYQKDY